MKKNIYSAFTLAEMMVVMLILSIVMAAFAPVMTTRSKSDRTSPWRYAANNSDIYFGLGDNQTAMIGQPTKVNGTDPSSRLIINTYDDNQNHLTFKRGADSLQGVMRLSKGGILLGTLNSGDLDSGSILIGRSITPGGQDSISIGRSTTVSADNAIAIGKNAISEKDSAISIGNLASAKANQSLAIGKDSKASEVFASAYGYNARALGKNSTAIGESALAEADHTIALHSRAIGKSSTAIGYGSATNEFSILLAPGTSTVGLESKSESSGYTSIAIGGNSHAKGGSSISLGTGAVADSYRAISIGGGSNTSGDSAIAMGYNAKAQGANSVSIGYNSKATDTDAVAIGHLSEASGESSIAIGSHQSKSDTIASGSASIAIGDGALAKGSDNIALGARSCQNVTGSNKVCIGADSGPVQGDSIAADASNFMYLGTSSTNVYIPGNLIVAGNVALATKQWSSIYARLRTGGDYWYSYLEMVDGSGAQNVRQSGWYRTKDNVSYSSAFPSDRKLKYVGKENTSGLDKIKQLKVFNYTFKKDEKKTPRVGVMAQDLQKVFPDAVTKNEDGFLTIRWEDMFYAVINSIKELALRLDKNEQKIMKLEKENQELRARLEKLEAKIK